eukprot:3236033-Rhodomonas_salina.1
MERHTEHHEPHSNNHTCYMTTTATTPKPRSNKHRCCRVLVDALQWSQAGLASIAATKPTTNSTTPATKTKQKQ